MKQKNPVQTGVQLQIDNEVTRCIRQHARAHMKTEVCGVLIGEQRGAVVEVQASIQASSAAQAGTHVTFTQDAWEEIYRVKDEKYPDERIVGWYHSHPGFGVFLSEHDTFIHKNFFSAPTQVAWVYDPHTDEEGCFGWFDGKIERIAALSVVDLNGDGDERTPKEHTYEEIPEPESKPNRDKQSDKEKALPVWARIALNTVSYLAVAMVAFFVALRFFSPPYYLPVAADPRTGQYMGFVLDPRTGSPIVGPDGLPEVIGPLHIEQLLRSQMPGAAPAPTVPAPTALPAPTPAAKPAITPGGTK